MNALGTAGCKGEKLRQDDPRNRHSKIGWNLRTTKKESQKQRKKRSRAPDHKVRLRVPLAQVKKSGETKYMKRKVNSGAPGPKSARGKNQGGEKNEGKQFKRRQGKITVKKTGRTGGVSSIKAGGCSRQY